MSETFVEQITGIAIGQEVSTVETGLKLTLSEPDRIVDGNGDWAFTVFADNDVFVASFSYMSQADAIRSRVAMAQALEKTVSVTTSKS